MALAVPALPAAARAADQPAEAVQAPSRDALAAAEARVLGCLSAAAEAHHLPPALLMILLKVEGGQLGRISQNGNGTQDIGPMQVNTIWVPKIAAHWRTTAPLAFLALRDSLCANLEGGAWILRRALDEARGDVWDGVAIYHSHQPQHQQAYLRKVLGWTLRLQAQASPPIAGTNAPAASSAAAVAPSDSAAVPGLGRLLARQ